MNQLQKDFNTAYLGVLAQGAPGVNERGSCMYEFDDKHCGIGFIFKEEGGILERLHQIGADEGIADLLLYDTDYLDFIPTRFYKHSDFYCDLQDAHDAASAQAHQPGPSFLELFRQHMAEVAARYKLEVPDA